MLERKSPAGNRAAKGSLVQNVAGPDTRSQPEGVTILQSHGPRLTKLVRRQPGGEVEIQGYENATTFRVIATTVAGLVGLEELLRRIEGNPREAIIRAEPLPETDPNRCRRLLHQKYENDGTRTPPSFKAVPRQWLAIDVDGVELPAKVDQQHHAVGHVVGVLPPEFAGADLIWQWTASAGIKPGLRCRLWFWLDRPVSSAELKRWFKGCPVDHSCFGDVQLIYTARPVVVGMPDPIKERIIFLDGVRRTVHVPTLPASPSPIIKPRPQPANAGRYASAALENACQSIAVASEGSRHPTLNAEAFCLARFIRSGELTAYEVVDHLIAAARRAGLTDGEQELRRFLRYPLQAGAHRAS